MDTVKAPMTTRKPWLACGVSRSLWYRAMSEGSTPAPVLISGVRHWRLKDLEQWLERLKPARSPYRPRTAGA